MMGSAGNSGAGNHYSHVIIGTGFAGTLMAIKLLERGCRDFIVLEKADRLGGTWRDNTYPGAACDVAAHLYSYSFARNPWWPSRFAKGPAIWMYHERVARKHGMLPYIRYRQEVAEARFDGRGWTVTTTDDNAYHADVVICATGRLHHPVLPEIPGAASFGGASFHTSRWDHSVPLDGKRVGLIGTGSTATQVITALASRVQRLSIFQRTAQWVFPFKDTPNPWWRRLAFWLSHGHWHKYYLQLRSETEARAVAATGTPEGRRLRDKACYDALAAIRDPELRAKLTPDYEVGCKRLVFSDGFYEAIQQPSIDLVTDGIDHIEERGVVTRDGKLHELDVLVYATGFDAHAYMRPMRVIGENGVSLDQVWADLPVTYQSMLIPQMPNFLMINGPYSPGGSASVIGIIEAQVDFLLKLLDRIEARDELIAPRLEAASAWLEGVREKARASVWGSGGCQSWYLDKTGTPTLDPSTLSELLVRLAVPKWDDFIETPRPALAGALPEAA